MTQPSGAGTPAESSTREGTTAVHATQTLSGSVPPVPPPPAGRAGSVPPLPPPAAARPVTIPPPPVLAAARTTGTFPRVPGLLAPGSVPPLPPPPRPDDTVQALAKAQREVRDLRNELSDARDQVKYGETQIAQLRATLAERDITVELLRAQLLQLTAARPQGDDLKRIRGIGPAFERVLNEAGVTSFAAIAAWDDQQILKMAAVLKTPPARIQHGQWVEQARELTRG